MPSAHVRQRAEYSEVTESLAFRASNHAIIPDAVNVQMYQEIGHILDVKRYDCSVALGTVTVGGIPVNEVPWIRMLLGGRKLLGGQYTLEEVQ